LQLSSNVGATDKFSVKQDRKVDFSHKAIYKRSR